MRAEMILPPADPWLAAAEITMAFPATPMDVREGLDRVLAHAALCDLGEEARGTLWTVLAEVLNNIAEHAYCDGPGEVQLRLWRMDNSVAVEVLDHGKPMPGLQMPEGKMAELGAIDDLPEGGFGWFLIRSMTDWLIYDRVAASNRLRFSLELA